MTHSVPLFEGIVATTCWTRTLADADPARAFCEFGRRTPCDWEKYNQREDRGEASDRVGVDQIRVVVA